MISVKISKKNPKSETNLQKKTTGARRRKAEG
jgi:hypothetical protein